MITDILLVLILIFVILMFITAGTSMILRVPFVPSNKKELKALESVSFNQYKRVCDLGSGTGTVLFYLKRKFPHLEVVGYELAILPYILSQLRNILHIEKIQLHCRDFLKEDLGRYDVLFCYLMPKMLQKVATKLHTYPHKQILITQAFRLPQEEPIRVIAIPGGSLKLYIYEI